MSGCYPGDTSACNELPAGVPPCEAGNICITAPRYPEPTPPPPQYPGFDLPDEPQYPSAPPTPAPRHGFPSFTAPRGTTPPPAAPAPPAQPPKVPPPATPVGEPPPDEPGYLNYNPQVFEDMQAAADAARYNRALGNLITLFTRYGGLIYAAGNDFFNLLTYSTPAGYDAATEAALVEQALYSFPPGRLPYADTVEPIGDIPTPDFAIPDLTRLPNPNIAPTDLPVVTVTAPRPAPYPLANPLANPIPFPGALEPGRLSGVLPYTQPLARPIPSSAPSPGRLTATRPDNPYRLSPARPRVRPGIRPGDFLTPTTIPPKPQEQPQTATRATTDDCVNQLPPKKKKQQKKHPRTVCWRGTYEEKANGLLKYRKERISCR